MMFPPDSTEEERQQMMDSTLLKNGNCPESIAAAALFLAENNFVTGTCLPIDGGRTIYATESTSRGRPI